MIEDRRSEAPVAVEQNKILATCFQNPELTQEIRWHKSFVKMVKNDKRKRMEAVRQTG